MRSQLRCFAPQSVNMANSLKQVGTIRQVNHGSERTATPKHIGAVVARGVNSRSERMPPCGRVVVKAAEHGRVHETVVFLYRCKSVLHPQAAFDPHANQVGPGQDHCRAQLAKVDTVLGQVVLLGLRIKVL